MNVLENANVIRIREGRCLLWKAGSAEPVAPESDQPLPKHTVFAAPSDVVRMTERSVSGEEAKHIAKALPFMLEDDVAEDVDALHFADRALGDGRYAVALCRRSAMLDWQQILPEGWDGEWIPEVLLLPWQSGEACLVVEGERVMCRTGEWAGATLEAALVPDFLPLLNPAPKSIIIYGQQQAQDLEMIPEPLRGRVQWRHGGLGQSMMLADPSQGTLDLRQREFAPRLPLGRWWSLWRHVAIGAAIAVALHLAADLLDYRRLAAENLALRQAIQESYRRVNPRGAVVDVEKQLDRQILALTPGTGGTAFTPLLASITRVLSEQSGVGIQSLNFSAGNGEVRVELVAEDFAMVETIRTRLGELGLATTLETSSSRNQQVRARLRIEGRSGGRS